MNSINIIKPYKYLDMWVFDDEKVGLLQEPFVSGADTLIDKATESIPNAEKGFILIFSKDYFPDTDLCLEWRRSDNAGNWYYSKEFDMEGWLCPALFKYFPEAPKNLYVKIKSI
ncbi:hypothetical protein JMI89_11565 [Frischella sp. Ac48]|uniref:DUF6717 family protein n=1 Tax=Orbaceae TaxID=1240483 RepID=UPI00080ED03A|nr:MULTISPECIES: DUF6717 family protein [Orbaceae]MBX4134263.1 hypothetical protein [Frischella sp. Ac48]OCF94210.1 hypothetical protein A9G10_02650 [Gilliamella apicola]